LRWFSVLLTLAAAQAGGPAKVETTTLVGQALVRLYNFDFFGAEAFLDRQIQDDPQSPLPYSLKGAVYLFSELDRLKILQMDFFEHDDKLIDRRKLIPDPKLRSEFFQVIGSARQRANARLAGRPDDREALFAQCMASGLVTDYAALVERRRLGSFTLAKETQMWARKLLALNPPMYDAYVAVGSAEYVIGSLPFFVRWFVRMDQIEGNKQRGIEVLQIVANQGKYYGPFARIMLAVIHLREKRPSEAERLLAGLAAEFPENPLIKNELLRAREIVSRTTAGRRR
jgi:hypothetical protein